MKKFIAIIITLFMAVSFIGCSADNTSEGSSLESYYKSKVQYVGNNSEVLALLDVIGAGDYGDYTISLHTDSEPYGVTVNYTDFNQKKDETISSSDLKIKYAYYALALVDNLSYIEIKSKSIDYRLDVEDASELLGKDIKSFGESVDSLGELDKLVSEFN